MKSLGLILLITIHSSSSAFASECKGKNKMFENDLDPDQLAFYAAKNSKTIKNAGDLMCCMTELDKSLKVVVMNNSIAAQGGTPGHPRVLVVKTDPKRGGIESVFSLNSGSPHLGGGNALEVFSYKNPVREARLYDIQLPATDFQKARQANPEKCMGCHAGADQSRNPLGGAKPIFERNPWARVNDKSSISKEKVCPNYKKHIDKIREDATTALEENDQYRCVKNLPRIPAFVFDDMIEDKNNDRLAKQVTNSKDFHKFQWAIAAVDMCKFEPEKFFPPHQITQMTNTDSILNPNLAAATTQEQILAEAAKPNQKIQNAIKSDSALVYDKNTNPNLAVDVTSCKERRHNADSLKIPNNVYAKYIADTRMELADEKMADYRYILESRGINISSWDTSHVEGYGRAPKLSQAFARQPYVNKELKQLIDAKDCDGLKKKSLAAFGPPPAYTDDQLNDESGGKKVQ